MIRWEILLGELFVFAVLMLTWRSARTAPRAKWAVTACALVAGIAWAGLWIERTGDQAAPQATEPLLRMPKAEARGGFVSSSACRDCHPQQHASWHDSFHRKMTQVATPDTVLGRFDDQVLTSRGQSVRLERRGEQFWAVMPDMDWLAEQVYEHGTASSETHDAPIVERPIVMTTGSHHYQAYWVPGRYGREVRQLPWVWHIGEQRWLPKVDSFLQPPTDEFKVVLWNQNCINCHTTAPVPGLNPQTQELFSTVVEFGIACEACHGAGGAHVRHYSDPQTRDQAHTGDDAIVNPSQLPAARASDICGQCHSFAYPEDPAEWWQHGQTRSFRPGDDLQDAYDLLEYDSDDDEFVSLFDGGLESLFWRDGAIRVGGREYHGLIMSPCYQRGAGERQLSCLSCHAMHGYLEPDDQLAEGAAGNRACTQCHQDERFTRDIQQHTHHPAGSRGSLCYECHMPHTTYALFKGIRCHRIDSPSAAMSTEYGRPNACNLCHLDRTLGWTAEHLSEWYGIEPPRLTHDEETIAASILWSLKGDAAQRALMAWHFSRPEYQEVSGTDWMPPYIAELLLDPYSAVRFVAHRAMRNLPDAGELDYDYIGPPARREEVARQILESWRERAAERQGRVLPADRLLLDADGDLRTDVVDRLLDQRDHHPISISE